MTTTTQKMTRSEIVRALKTGTFTVNFRKLDGTKRAARATLSKKLIPASEIKEGVKLGGDSKETVTYWDLDNNAWRSFRVDRIVGKIKEAK